METRSLILLALCVACAEPHPEPVDALLPLQKVLKARSDEFNPYATDFTQEYEPVAFAAIPLGSPVPIIAVLSENPLEQAKQLQQAVATSLKQAYAKPDYQQNYVPTEYSSYAKPDYQKSYVPSEYSNYAKPYEEYQKPDEYLKPKPYVPPEYKRPSLEYPKHYSSIEFAKPYSPVEYAKPYPMEYVKPYPVEYAKPYPVEYAKPYPVEYAKPYPAEYAKPYPVEYVKPYPVEYTKPYQEEYDRPYATEEKPTILYARPTKEGGYTYSRRPLKKRNVKRPQRQKPVILRVHKYRVIRSRSSDF